MVKKIRQDLFLRRKNEGLILVEIILALGIFSFLLVGLLDSLGLFLKFNKEVEEKSGMLKNINHAYEYIIREIESSDGIFETIHIDGFNNKFKNNIGFVIKFNKDKSSNAKPENADYNYISYYIRNGNLIRVAANLKTSIKPSRSDFSGYNKLISNVRSFEGTKIDLNNEYINLIINTKDDIVSKGRFINLEYKDLSYE